MSGYSAVKIKKEKNAAFSAVLIRLLQGFIVSDEKKYWEPLLIYQEAIREYFFMLGLELHLSIDDGYAFLKQQRIEQQAESKQALIDEDSEAVEGFDGALADEQSAQFPTLVRRIPLSFDVSLLCILLREALEQFDSKVNDDHRFVLHRVDIYELLKLFYAEKTDETKQAKRFDALINRVVELGFLKELKGNQNSFEVRRMIKAQFDAEKLAEIKTRMITEIGVGYEQ